MDKRTNGRGPEIRGRNLLKKGARNFGPHPHVQFGIYVGMYITQEIWRTSKEESIDLLFYKTMVRRNFDVDKTWIHHLKPHLPKISILFAELFHVKLDHIIIYL